MKKISTSIFKRINISMKIFIMTFLMVSAMIIAVSLLYSNKAKDILLDEQIEYALQFTSKSDKYLELNLNNIHGFILSVANDPKLHTGNYDHLHDWFSEYLKLYIPNSKNIHLLEEEKVVVSSSHTSWLLNDHDEFMNNVIGIATKDRIQWSMPYYSPVSGQTVTAVIKMNTDENKKLFLALDVDLAQLYNNIFPNTLASLQGKLILLDYYNNPLFGSSPYIVYDPFDKQYELNIITEEMLNEVWDTTTEKINGEEHFFVRSQSNPLLWQVVWILDKNVIFSSLQQGMDYYWQLTIVSLFISLFIAFVISTTIGRPIKLIAKSMDHVGLGNWDTKISLKRNDELGNLVTHFNDMTSKISDLVKKLKETEQAKKDADFSALQSQIRPHFIFNTLNTISIAAREQNFEKVDQLISSFSESIHYSLDSAPTLVPLEDEINAIKNYIYLMQIRYDYQFDFEMDIDENTTDFKLPKFSIQPLVENAIFHGLIPAKYKGILFIGTELDENCWFIIIEDNGVGMSREKQLEMKERLKEENYSTNVNSDHIGVRNVHSRMKLVFGDAYNIQIKSDEQNGTRLILTLPIITEE